MEAASLLLFPSNLKFGPVRFSGLVQHSEVGSRILRSVRW